MSKKITTLRKYICLVSLMLFSTGCAPCHYQEEIYTVIKVYPLENDQVDYLLLSPSNHKIILKSSKKKNIKLWQKIKFI